MERERGASCDERAACHRTGRALAFCGLGRNRAALPDSAVSAAQSARSTIVASGGKVSEAECGQPWLEIASV
ncbi:hypothetical protein BgramDRAFT_1059 [Paraburkholderia graminis C4D1M]|uniref:Uncharacterized protein n=1 Tax=Paraburkholderia graminis (strain ATCC 700544 / DSM 17151 / LMG 18924 / NCIMB 13744 / C4D1M) TaxID=396598 RepID=B1FV37_PARG4|nr:hypothetical protein BgramDRAFT_1059 [Paraburkholderia graminis C4D1M]